MSNPLVRRVGTVRDRYGRPMDIGVDHDAVTIGEYAFSPQQQKEFAQLYVAACHDAAANAEALARQEAHGG